MAPLASRTLRAEWIWSDGRLLPRQRVSIEDGLITAVTPLERDEATDQALLLPAFHNAHSHAFQWAMRGATQHLDAGHTEDDFWSWRDKMFAVAGALDLEEAYAVALACYRQMVAQGYASVGEFHYLHRRPDLGWYEPQEALAEVHCEAARAAGLTMVLIPVAYERGGHNRALVGGQRRFDTTDAATYLSYAARLRDQLSGDGVSVALGCHSLRACSRATLQAVAREASLLDLPLHIHACEQRRELRESIEEYGTEPLEVLASVGFLGPHATIVHGTHLAAGDIERLRATRTTVCACPTTERDLGDGFLEAYNLIEAGVPIAIGSDSQTSVSPREEMRLMEFHERLRRERRNALTYPARALLQPSSSLLSAGSRAGAEALGLRSGRIAAGLAADLVALAASGPLATEEEAQTLLHTWLFCDPAPPFAQVYTQGLPRLAM